jgi:hypothetical protein
MLEAWGLSGQLQEALKASVPGREEGRAGAGAPIPWQSPRLCHLDPQSQPC